MLQKTPASNDSKSVCGQPHVGSNPTVSARAGSDFTLPAFLYRLLCTIFGTASGHTIHCICRSLLRVVIQVSVDVCCSRIGTMFQPYLDLFHCDIFTAVKQMPCPPFRSVFSFWFAYSHPRCSSREIREKGKGNLRSGRTAGTLAFVPALEHSPGQS